VLLDNTDSPKLLDVAMEIRGVLAGTIDMRNSPRRLHMLGFLAFAMDTIEGR
jgi:hypothetical protein